MLYAEKVLQPGETIRFTTKLHWIIFLRGILFIVLGVLVAAGLREADSQPADHMNALPLIAIAIGLVCGIFSLISAWCRRYIAEFTVTDRRIIVMHGFIWRHSLEINMSEVETVIVDQSMLGRALDYGDLEIRGTGTTRAKQPRHIACPMVFREFVIAR